MPSSPTSGSIAQPKPAQTENRGAPLPPDRQANLLPALIEQLPDAVLFMDRDFRITYANARSRELSRLAPADLNTKTLWQIFPNTLGTDLELYARGAMSDRISEHFEYYYEPFNIWVDMHVFPIEHGVALSYRDITSHKRTEAARDEAGSRLHLVFESCPDSILCIDRNWSCTFANRAARVILKSDQLLGVSLWAAFPLNRSEPFASSYRTTMEQRIPTEFEAWHPAPLNLWLKVYVHPFEDGIILFSSDITLQKKAEARRDANARQLEQVFEATADGVISLSRDWTYTFLNRRAQELLAIKGDLIGKNLWEEFPDANSSIFGEYFRRVMNERIACELEDFYPEPLNMWLHIQCRPSADGIVIFFRDVSVERTARQALLDQQATLAFVQETAGVATWTIDLATGEIVFGPGSQPVFGHPLAAIHNLSDIAQFVGPEQFKKVQARTLEAIETRQPFVIEYPITAADGTIRWIERRGVPLYDAKGNATHLRGMSTDITVRRRQIEELAASTEALYNQHLETERQRAELETVYRTAPVGLGLFDPVEFRYLRLNDRLAEIIGLPPQQILGRTIDEIAPLSVRAILERAVAEKTIQRHLIEGQFPGRPGENHFFNVNYSPVFGPDGSVQAIATATLDITHQKKSEAALIQSEKLAAVGRLASSISHEINNPLEAITNILYLIDRDETLPGGLRPLVTMAQSELSRVCQIATQTLRFHRQAVRATQVTAQNLVGAVLNLYQGRLANTGIAVEAVYASATPILCFENDIRQVLNNLIANAIDAMRQYGGRLIVRAHDTSFREPGNPSAGPVPAVRITIADTGHGMPPEVRARIFEPFYTTKDLNGTGLGLWISSGIVNRHNGRLTVRSSTHPTHHGTIFSLTLPTDDQPSQVAP